MEKNKLPSRSLILKRGTAEQIKNIVFPMGELVLDTTNMRLVVGDGKTKGGINMAKLADITTKRVKNG